MIGEYSKENQNTRNIRTLIKDLMRFIVNWLKNNNGIHVKFTNKDVWIFFLLMLKLKSAARSLCFVFLWGFIPFPIYREWDLGRFFFSFFFIKLFNLRKLIFLQWFFFYINLRCFILPDMFVIHSVLKDIRRVCIVTYFRWYYTESEVMYILPDFIVLTSNKLFIKTNI